MARETEIKLRIDNVRAFLRTLKRMGARTVGLGTGRVLEENVIFDTPQGGLAKHGQLLRIRTEIPGANGRKPLARPLARLKRRVMLTFKQPVASSPATSDPGLARTSHKVREEIEVEVADADVLTKIFEGLGMSGWFRYEKYRTTYRLPT